MLTLRITYSKGEEIKFVSHLDHMRVLERAIRRADLPVAYSQGFNPRMKISFKTRALKVGETSDACQADITFVEEVSPSTVLFELNNTLPKGLLILSVDAL